MRAIITGKGWNGYDFEGYSFNTDFLENGSGECSILCEENSKLCLIDAKESTEVKTRVKNHDRKDYWKNFK